MFMFVFQKLIYNFVNRDSNIHIIYYYLYYFVRPSHFFHISLTVQLALPLRRLPLPLSAPPVICVLWWPLKSLVCFHYVGDILYSADFYKAQSSDHPVQYVQLYGLWHNIYSFKLSLIDHAYGESHKPCPYTSFKLFGLIRPVFMGHSVLKRCIHDVVLEIRMASDTGGITQIRGSNL